MTKRSLLAQMILERTRVELPTWVTARRDQGHAWAAIAEELNDLLDVRAVTGESLRRWFG